MARIGGLGGGGLLIVILLAAFCGVDPAMFFQGPTTAGLPESYDVGPAVDPGSGEKAAFVGVVLADTEDVWSTVFREEGWRYEEPTLVLFTGRTRSACGLASAATGPFYCPADRKVYIDLGFYDELQRGFGVAGDFAQAYVIAHEIGHHVQTLLGISQSVHSRRERLPRSQYNRLSVKLELQADCLAGVWAHRAEKMRQILEPGDVQEALSAASAIGDDRIQRQSQGYVVPDSFTHGTSRQRLEWFSRGLRSGDFRQCDTFGPGDL